MIIITNREFYFYLVMSAFLATALGWAFQPWASPSWENVSPPRAVCADFESQIVCDVPPGSVALGDGQIHWLRPTP